MTENNPYRKHYAHYPEGVDINCSNCAGAFDEGVKLVAEDIKFFDHAYSDTEWGDKQFRKSVVVQLKKGWLNEKV